MLLNLSFTPPATCLNDLTPNRLFENMPSVNPKSVRTSEKAKEMCDFDMEHENETVRNYRQRARQCEALGEYAIYAGRGSCVCQDAWEMAVNSAEDSVPPLPGIQAGFEVLHRGLVC